MLPLVPGTPTFVLISWPLLTDSCANVNTNWQIFSLRRIPNNYIIIAYAEREAPASEPLPIYVVSLIRVWHL